MLSFVVFGSVVCSPPAFRVSISGCRMFDMWTVTILIYDVWTLHSCPKADCSTRVPSCSANHLQLMMSACVSRLCWHVSPCVSPEGLLVRYLTEGCTRRRQSSLCSESWCSWLEHHDAVGQLLRKLGKVCDWVQAVILDCPAVAVDGLIVCNDFVACNPSLNEDAVFSDFGEDVVVIGVVSGSDDKC